MSLVLLKNIIARKDQCDFRKDVVFLIPKLLSYFLFLQLPSCCLFCSLLCFFCKCFLLFSKKLLSTLKYVFFKEKLETTEFREYLTQVFGLLAGYVLFGSGHWPGVLLNMTVAEIKNAESSDGQYYIIDVCMMI